MVSEARSDLESLEGRRQQSLVAACAIAGRRTTMNRHRERTSWGHRTGWTRAPRFRPDGARDQPAPGIPVQAVRRENNKSEKVGSARDPFSA